MGVIQCESAEAAVQVLEKIGECVSMIFTDVNLGGRVDGVELAHFGCAERPGMHQTLAMAPAPHRTAIDGKVTCWRRKGSVFE